MNSRISVHIFDEFESVVSDDWLRSIAEQTLDIAAQKSGPAGGAIGLVIGDDQTVRDLNRRHRDVDETTDVLSFAFDHQGEYHGEEEQITGPTEAVEFVLPQGQDPMLGEVVISYPRALLQAQASGIEVRQEVAHLLAHGVLHLLGYDHSTPEEDAVMKTLEHRVLGDVPQHE
jgi:probable rRNA maturation factor